MVYVQTLYDNFNDNSIDTSKWTVTAGAADVLESSSRMNLWATNLYGSLLGNSYFDATRGLLAVKWGSSGSADAAVEHFFGIRDNSGYRIGLSANPSTAAITMWGSSGTSIGTIVKTDTTVGLGPSWVQNTWLGIGNIGSDNILRVYKSTDAVTWTEMIRCTIGGTFNKYAVRFDGFSGRSSGTASWLASWDDASYFFQTLIDNFDDNVIDTAKWTNYGGSKITESSQKLNIQATVDYPSIYGSISSDLSTGIFAVKYAKTGTATADTEFYAGVHDGSGNIVQIFANPVGSTYTLSRGGSATVSNIVKTDTTVGLGPSWTNGTWLGFGNMGSDGVMRFFKSTDAVTWTEIARCTVGGTFDKANAKLYFSTGLWDLTSPWVANLDDASFFPMALPPSNPKYKVRVGGAWVPGLIKVRVGGVWVTAKPKVRVGGAWVTPKSS